MSDPVLRSSASASVVLPGPPTSPSPWALAVAAAVVAGVAVGGAGAARADLDLVAALSSGASVMAAQALGLLASRRASRVAHGRWDKALDETEAVCLARLESRRRALLRLWPTSADLADRLRRGEASPVVGRPSLVVLGVGTVESGIVLLGDTGGAVVGPARAVALRERVADLPDGPLCVDTAGGLHVRGPSILARSLAGGYRAQLRHRGADECVVTWQSVGAAPAEARLGPTAGGGASLAACVLEISSLGAVTVVRRDGSACEVPVTPAWTSLLDAPGASGALDVPGRSEVLDGLGDRRREPLRPECR
ncbi:hypothetical protein ES689_03300 [Frigoribacterium sp. ACAM 257]|uniref:hypothetical protein n=1 Tax=Frigoribacterium sp. ACAM 257 TaxID=2508998 RepID=UPI0011B9B8B5|nr:hypothetical protein [Frigoribacterium sp. ACAM 257]TWX40491.1 hypothetical protein ES689_03300 [Frigoribacterium sp. ACAM 257]